MSKKVFNLFELGKSIKQERKARKMTQQDLASLANLTRQTIINIEKGEDVSVLTLFRTLLSLGMTLSIDTEKPNFIDLGRLMDES